MTWWVREGLGGLTMPLCKAGDCLAQALNLEKWISQARTQPLQGSAHLPQSLIKMRKLPKYNT